MRFGAWALAASLAAGTAAAQDHAGHAGHEAHAEPDPASTPAQLVIVINPEARVAVSRGREPPPVCAPASDLRIAVFNQGKVTGPLLAGLAEGPPPGVALEADLRLSGAPRQDLVLRLRSTRRTATDLTIAFRLPGEPPELGGRGQVHLLVRCPSSTPAS